MDDRRKPDCCVLCDEPVFERGKLISDAAWRTHLLLTDGTTAAITICDGCSEAEICMPALWRRILAAFMFEAGLRGTMPSRPPLTPEQAETERAHLLSLTRNVPVGVLCRERWSEVINA